MKKKLTVFLLIILSLLVLSGCACEHEWTEANCTTPKTCTKCEEVEGIPLGHSWMAATCSAPKTCENCGETSGEALPHTLADATCEDPKTCTVCAATEGEALGHQWVDATYDAPKTCTACAATEGEALKREYLAMTNDELAAKLNGLLSSLGQKLEYLSDDEDGWPVFDLVSVTTGASTNVGITFEPTADGSKVYAIAVYTFDVGNDQAITTMASATTVFLLGLDENFDTDLLAKTLAGSPQIIDGTVVYYMQSCGIAAELQITEGLAMFWIYPVD